MFSIVTLCPAVDGEYGIHEVGLVGINHLEQILGLTWVSTACATSDKRNNFRLDLLDVNKVPPI